MYRGEHTMRSLKIATAAAGPSTIHLGRVVIISEHEGHARLDREMAKGLGAESLAVFTTGRDAEAWLRNNPADVIICDRKLADMDGLAFSARLRADAELARVPLVLASNQGGELDILTAVAHGCSAYLLRPYTIDSFEQQIRRAKRQGRLPEKVINFAARLHEEKARQAAPAPQKTESAERPIRRHANRGFEAHSLYMDGRRQLRMRQWNKAVVSFSQAVKLNPVMAEAYEGLAQAWKAKKITVRYLDNAWKAIRLFANQDRYMELKQLYADLLRDGHELDNPFLAEGLSRQESNNLEGAVQSYRRAVHLEPSNERALIALAHALLAQERQEQAIQALEQALARDAMLPMARDLHQRLTHRHVGILSMVRSALGTLRNRTLRLATGYVPAQNQVHAASEF